MKVLGKALAAAAGSAAMLNTVNGGNVKISIILIAAAFLGTFLMEFFADAKPDLVDAAIQADKDVQDTPVYQQGAAIITGGSSPAPSGVPSNVSATVSESN